jgi:hypothetical protein
MYTPTKTPDTLSVKTVQDFFKDISKKNAPVLVVIDNKEYVLECLLEQKDSVYLYAGVAYTRKEV